MKEALKKRAWRQRRKSRIRARVAGTQAQPRLSVFRSSGQIYAQLIDDTARATLVAVSSLGLSASAKLKKVAAAHAVGEQIGQRAVQLGITRVVFDRGGYAYHGRVKALAEGARAAGLEF